LETLGQRHYTDREGRPAEYGRADGASLDPAFDSGTCVDPAQLGGAAANVDDQGEVVIAVDEIERAEKSVLRLLLRRDRFHAQTERAMHLVQERLAVGGSPTGLRCNVAGLDRPMLFHLVVTTAQGIDSAAHRFFGKLAGPGQPLAQPDDL